eukprot:scaffold1047_cov112-Isochrysis_galbana.AAC.4
MAARTQRAVARKPRRGVLVALLLLQSSGARPGKTRASPAELHRQRLQALFDCLARTHGGPSFISDGELAILRQEALRRLHMSFEAESTDQISRQAEAGADGGDRMEEALTRTSEWSMAQLSDPHAKYIQPAQAEEMSDRYHGRVELGVRTCDEPCQSTSGGWQSLRLPPRPRMWRTLVTAVAERSPAERAGLRVGDEILEVAGNALRDGSAQEHTAVEPLLQAEEGARVPILVRRIGCDRPIRLSLRCTLLPPRTVSTRLVRLPTSRGAAGGWRPGHAAGEAVDQVAAILQIDHFGAGTAREVEAELRKLSARGVAGELPLGGAQRLLLFLRLPPFGPARKARMDGVQRERAVRAVLFDLRDNGGGVLKAAVQTSRLVVPRGAHILSLQKQRHGAVYTVSSFRRRWYHRSTPFGARPRRRSIAKQLEMNGACGKTRWEDVPLLVLVNRNTASAAEVFAAAISHAQRGLILGSPTFGKGTSQAFVSLEDGHALTFTVYSLAAGARGATHPLNDGVKPHISWPWPTRAATFPALADREIVLATQAALASLPTR